MDLVFSDLSLREMGNKYHTHIGHYYFLKVCLDPYWITSMTLLEAPTISEQAPLLIYAGVFQNPRSGNFEGYLETSPAIDQHF